MIPIEHSQPIKAQRSSSDDNDSSEVNEAISYDYSLLANLFGDSGDEVMQEASSNSNSNSSSDSNPSSSSIVVGYMLPYLVNIAG